MTHAFPSFAEHDSTMADKIVAVGRFIGLLGVVLVLLLIGGLKFTQVEIDGLKPIIGPTPWLAWMYSAFGEAGTSYLLGVIELATAVLLMLSPWFARAGLVGGAVASLTFFVTTTIMFAAPIWETASGGFPWINELGQFLIKDVALLGVALMVFGESLARTSTAHTLSKPSALGPTTEAFVRPQRGERRDCPLLVPHKP